MKRCIIAIISILLLNFVLLSYINISNAVGLEILQDPDSYISDTDKNGNKYDQSGAISIGNIIIWLVRTIGQSVSVVMLIVIGIKYVLASASEKAEYKQTMWPYILGAVLLFSGATVTDMIYKAFQS